MIAAVLRVLGVIPDKIMYIGGSDILPPPLERELEAKTIHAMTDGDQQAKSTLIGQGNGLVGNVFLTAGFEIHSEFLLSIYNVCCL